MAHRGLAPGPVRFKRGSTDAERRSDALNHGGSCAPQTIGSDILEQTGETHDDSDGRRPVRGFVRTCLLI